MGYVSMSNKLTYKELEQRLEVLEKECFELKQGKKALPLERDNLISILDSMEDGVYIVNQHYDIEYYRGVLN